jgi:outer membrane protein
MALIALGLWCTGMAAAQEGTYPLTLREAIERALARNPLLQAAQHETQAAAAGVAQARAGFFPKIDFSESFMRADNPVFVFSAKLNQGRFTQNDFEVQRLNHPDAVNDFTTRFSLEQPLYQGGKVSLHLGQARLQHQASEQKRDRRQQEVIFQVAQAYYNVLRVRAELDVAHGAIQAATANRDLARDRFQTGLAVASDVLSAEVRLASLKEREITASHQVLLAKAVLNDAMGMPLDTPFEMAEALQLRPSRYQALDGLEALALQQRPDYQTLQTDANVSERDIALARSAFYPRLDLMASYEWHQAELVTEGQDSWFVGLTLRWNLFNGLADRARASEARANLARVQALRASLGSRIKLEIKEAFLRLQAARQRIDVASGAVSQAEESLRIIRNRYEAGITTVVNLLVGEEALTRAQGNLTSALYDYNVSLASLELALGTISKEAF